MVEYTASIASGYATDVQYNNSGNNIVIMGHLSAVSNATGFFRTGLQIIKFADFQFGADSAKTYIGYATGVGGTALCGFGLNAYFSGQAASATGYFMIVGQ